MHTHKQKLTSDVTIASLFEKCVFKRIMIVFLKRLCGHPGQAWTNRRSTNFKPLDPCYQRAPILSFFFPEINSHIYFAVVQKRKYLVNKSKKLSVF